MDVLGAVSKPAPGVHILNGHMITRGEAQPGHAEAFRRMLQQLSESVELPQGIIPTDRWWRSRSTMDLQTAPI